MASEDDKLDEPTLTLEEWVNGMEEDRDTYTSLLGACDEKTCSYKQGKLTRQALYSCLTCCPEANVDINKCAGICYACTIHCHEHHELVELYTRREFRCDCPTVRAGSNPCLLNSELGEKQPANIANRYDHNFQGLYCKCKRPYPDPDNTEDEEMHQCVVCEDWFHFVHLEFYLSEQQLAKPENAELICDVCMDKHPFLYRYTNLMVNGDKLNTSPAVTALPSNNATELNNEEDQSADTEPQPKKLKLDTAELAAVAGTSNQCRRPADTTATKKGAVLWTSDWRKHLCTCTNCMLLYKQENLEYLFNADDSIDAYEARGRKLVADREQKKIQKITSNLGYSKQLEIISKMEVMKQKFKAFLEPFARDNRVITCQDVEQFIHNFPTKDNDVGGQ